MAFVTNSPTVNVAGRIYCATRRGHTHSSSPSFDLQQSSGPESIK